VNDDLSDRESVRFTHEGIAAEPAPPVRLDELEAERRRDDRSGIAVRGRRHAEHGEATLELALECLEEAHPTLAFQRCVVEAVE
jgi:hypothetical protein